MKLGMKTYFLQEYVDFLYLNNVQDLTIAIVHTSYEEDLTLIKCTLNETYLVGIGPSIHMNNK